ncbi:MAG TPA: carbamoyl phosphate synthase small subunit, partial [Nitrososphaerales archaeon]|nr:carbamoyl phosphate synthase small subunit [Nitrososphaerales archaeon]
MKLVLDDGKSFDGFSLGSYSHSPVVGEVVFNTGMVGYTEAMTDPSYAGQILCFTYPLIGNYGVPDYVKDENEIFVNFESGKIRTKGIIVSQASANPSHYEMKRTLDGWMRSEAVSGMEGIDTRELTLHLRERGVMMGAISQTIDEGAEALRNVQDYSKIDYCRAVSTDTSMTYGKNVNGRIAVFDCGVKLNIVRSLVKRGFEVTVLPYATVFDETSSKFNGIVISNGPGDPKNCFPAIEFARKSIEMGIPVLGICLGTQIIALSLGADTYKLKYG